MSDETLKRIDEIQAVRARNNTAWMDILRLAHKMAPAEAQAISDRINDNDEEILRLNGRLGTPKVNYKHLVGIQARMSSTRLPGKVMADICGAPMIQRVWDACAGPWIRVVLTSVDPSDDILCGYLSEKKISYMRGSLEDVLSRYLDAMHAYQPERMVRVCADAPFIRSEWIALALAERSTVVIPEVLHAGNQRAWRYAEIVSGGENKEHAGFEAFDSYASKIPVAPKDYLMVNTQEDLEEARRRWAAK